MNLISVKHAAEDGGCGWASLSTGTSGTVVWSWGAGWDHVSFAPFNRKRIPTWEEMCELKRMFFGEDVWVVEFHPPEAEYVNNMPNCLHLWRPITEKMPIPQSWMVGLKKGQRIQDVMREISEAQILEG